jgi:adenylate cyclase
MPDIFISYSHQDSVQASELAERLRARGIGVWMDRGIVGAEQWATEIADSIRSCSTFIVLLSPASIESESVLKELSLASEKRKRILPVDLAPVLLPSSFEYSLSGLQRVAIGNFDGILHAHHYGVARKSQKDKRKSLIILPFEDLSSSQDNLWFADGLAGELIDALGHIKSLRILDRKTSVSLRGVKQTIVEIGKLFDTRYFIEGTVRKFGEEIKISCSLLDIETGDHLWQESHRGGFKDIFDIQEAVAQKVVEGLKLHLTKEERSSLEEWGTEHPDAYELFVRGREYYHYQTKEGFETAIRLFADALALDPAYASAYQFKAAALAALYRSYERNPALLTEAESLTLTALKIKPDFDAVYNVLSQIYTSQKRFIEAEEITMEFAHKSPKNHVAHFALGFFYFQTGQHAKAIGAYEESVRLKPDELPSLLNLVIECDEAGEKQKCIQYAALALPLFERYLTLHPDDEFQRVSYALLLFWSGRQDRARQEALHLKDRVRDGGSLYNMACLLTKIGEPIIAIEACKKAILNGFRDERILKLFLEEDLVSLKETPEYGELDTMVNEIFGK